MFLVILLEKKLGRPILKKLFSTERIAKVEDYFAKYGGWAIVVAGFTPIPYKLFTISAGVFEVRMSVLVIASIIGRGARFFLEGFTIFFFGDIAQYYLKNYFELITIAVTLACVLLYFLWKHFKTSKNLKGTGLGINFRKFKSYLERVYAKYKNYSRLVFYFITELLLSIFSLLAFMELLEDYYEKGSWSFDQVVFQYLYNMRSDGLTTFFKAITYTGNPISLVILTAILCFVFFYFKKKKEAVFIALYTLGAFGFNQILKTIIARPRPIGFRLVNEQYYSFPSGHAMVMTAFVILLVYIGAKYFGKRKIIYVAATFIILYAGLIGISRVYLGVHYFSDVLAGWMVGIMWAMAGIFAFRYSLYRKTSNKQ